MVTSERTSLSTGPLFFRPSNILSISRSSCRVVLMSMLTFLDGFSKFSYTVLDIELLHLSNEASDLAEADLVSVKWCRLGQSNKECAVGHGVVGSSVAIKNGVLTESASCASATSRVARNRKFMMCLGFTLTNP